MAVSLLDPRSGPRWSGWVDGASLAIRRPATYASSDWPGQISTYLLDSVRGTRLVITAEGDEPAWFRPTVAALSRLLRLPEGWDSYGGSSIDPLVVRATINLLADTMRPDTPPPTVVPTSNGGVQLEWHLRGIDLEVVPHSLDHVSVAYEDRVSGDEWEAELRFDFTHLAEVLAELSHRE